MTDSSVVPRSDSIKLLAILAVIICAYESLMKGWFSFFLLPASLVLLPAFTIVQHIALKQKNSPYVREIRLMSLLLTIAMLMLYVCMVGFGDTDEAFLFGFLRSSVDSPLAAISQAISVAGMVLTPIFFLILIVLLIVDKHQATRS